MRYALMISGSPSRIRTCDSLINSQVLYRLSYRGMTTWKLYGIVAAFVKRFCRQSRKSFSLRLRLG